MLGDEDLAAVFYGADFALPFTRTRTGAPSLTVHGILGAVDQDALDGRTLAAVRTLQLPATADLRADDLLQSLQAEPAHGVALGQVYRVLQQPQRMNDGAEQQALLGTVSA